MNNNDTTIYKAP